jgi:hypothetical protein
LTVAGGVVDEPLGSGTTLLIGENAGSTGLVSYTDGNLHARTITVGDAGYGSMFVSSNADFQPFDVRVALQSSAAGELSLRGGMLFSSPLRRTGTLQVGVATGSTGVVWVTDGVLLAGDMFSCFQDNSVLVGMQGSGRLSATNSTLYLYNLSVGSAGTLECVNSQLAAQTAGCSTLNNNVMSFINSVGTFSGSVQNNGTLIADESTLTFSGSLTTQGTIIATNGTVLFLGSINNSGNVVLGPDLFRIISATASGNDVAIAWQAFAGNRYRVQAATDLVIGFSDISSEIAAIGNGMISTNYIDDGALTNSSRQFYRVRQVW